MKKMKTAGILISCLLAAAGCGDRGGDRDADKIMIVASDTIIGGIVAELLPEESFAVHWVLPPDQCPGHYDVKLSDIERVNRADLAVLLQGMPISDKLMDKSRRQLLVDSRGANWMVPANVIRGAAEVAAELAAAFPEHAEAVAQNAVGFIAEVERTEAELLARLERAGAPGSVVVGSNMQSAPLEWMGFEVIGLYGRPESFSSQQVVGFIREGRERGAVLVVDNQQSGPSAGVGIAEALGVPHMVLSNFPSEEGYVASLVGNVDRIIAALEGK